MSILEIILSVIVLAYITAKSIIALIRKVKGLDKESREAILEFTACLIEKGVKIPDELMVKILRGQIGLKKLSAEFNHLAK